MHLVEVFHEQGLICERQPLRITEKGRANHHHLRAHRDKGAAKEKAAVPKEEVMRKPPELMRGPEEEAPGKVVGMARTHKRPKTGLWAKERFVREAPKVAEAMKAWVAEAAMKAATMASCMASEAASETAQAMGPALRSQQRYEQNDNPNGYSFRHGFALLDSFCPATKKGQALASMAPGKQLFRCPAPCRLRFRRTRRAYSPAAGEVKGEKMPRLFALTGVRAGRERRVC